MNIHETRSHVEYNTCICVLFSAMEEVLSVSHPSCDPTFHNRAGTKRPEVSYFLSKQYFLKLTNFFFYPSYILSSFSHLSSLSLSLKVGQFFQGEADLGSGARAVRQAIEIIRRNIQWLRINQDLIQHCLTDTESCFSPCLSM